jgi:hypothetical protein
MVSCPPTGELAGGENMKVLGILLIVIAAVLLYLGATMDISYGGYANLSLMNQRTNLLIVGSCFLIGGVIALANGATHPDRAQLRFRAFACIDHTYRARAGLAIVYATQARIGQVH